MADAQALMARHMTDTQSLMAQYINGPVSVASQAALHGRCHEVPLQWSSVLANQ
jgi:hypothetical protein